LRVRLARSKKTGNSKGYAFVEFDFKEVAQIAAETMNNYLMFNRLIKCELLAEKSSAEAAKIFATKRISKTFYPKLESRNKVKLAQMLKHSDQEEKAFMEHRLASLEKTKKKWEELGIGYEFDSNKQDSETPISPKEKGVKPSPKKQRLEKSSPKQPLPAKPTHVKPSPKVAAKVVAIQKTKFSPKILRSRKSGGQALEKSTPKSVKTQVAAAEKAEASPKMLRGRKSEAVLEKVDVIVPEKAKASPKMLKGRKNEAVLEKVDVISPEKAKASPKMSKGRKSEVVLEKISPKSVKIRKSEGIVPEKTKFSPKLLRSRKSEVIVSEISKALPKAAKPRKSEGPVVPQKTKFSPKLLRNRRN